MANTKQQLTSALYQFYNQPIARVSLELFLSIGAVIFFAVFAIRPTLLTMSDLIKEIEDKTTLDGQLSQKIAALSTAQSEYLSLEKRLIVLDEGIPSTPQLITSLKILEKIASDQRLYITGMNAPDVPEETPADLAGKTLERKMVPISITVSGDYPSIRAYLEAVKNARRVFVIESVVFSTGEERGVKRLRATINIGLPYFGVK